MKPRLKKISDQVIVITGASSGIGLATAREAAQRGAAVVLAARNEEALRQICEELRAQGARAEYIAADVANEDEVRRIATVALERFGGFDTWMNIAGVSIFGKNEQVSLKDMRRLFDTNFWGVVHGSLVALPHLKARGGALINVGSETSERGIPLQGMYSASKQAIKGFTDSLRTELEQEGAPVAVTLIKPGSVDTMLVRHAKNYMAGEPRLPGPVYAPEIVADALLHAAQHPTRDMYVGGGARMMTGTARHAPRILDQLLARFMYRSMESEQPARDRDDNSLYSPRADLLERGGVGPRPREFSIYTRAAMHPAATTAALLGAGVAVAAVWKARHRRQAMGTRSGPTG